MTMRITPAMADLINELLDLTDDQAGFDAAAEKAKALGVTADQYYAASAICQLIIAAEATGRPWSVPLEGADA
jgi:hypothetical protein